MRSLLLPGLCVAVLLSAACSQKVLVKASTPGARVSVGDLESEEVPEEGVRVKVAPGLSAVPFVVEDDGNRREGVIERTEVQWGWIAAGVAGALCCVPALAFSGACLANPALAAATVGCLITQSPAPCCAALAAPSCATVPLAGTGAVVGLAPLSLGLLAEQVPEEVVIESAPPSSAAPSGEVPF